MHEFKITERLFHVAVSQADLRAGETIQRLNITLDPDSGYAPDAIRFYFEQIAKNTPAAGAELAFTMASQPSHLRLTSIDVHEAAGAEDAPNGAVHSHVDPHGASRTARWHIAVTGAVQGVGFRPFVHNLARQLDLHGWVRNTSTGLELELQGPQHELAHFCHHLGHDAPPLARILEVTVDSVPVTENAPATLEIRNSQRQDGRTWIAPDAATCPPCLGELFDRTDRRFHYPFTNCTHCGPRFTIITRVPYDRPNTTMRAFPLCAACAAEYGDAADRRFHAQPVACPNCGPRLWFQSESARCDGTGEALRAAVALLNRDGILAVKGLGGFHLACRATSAGAVQRLRAGKCRPDKPLAVMVRSIQEARELVHLTATDEELLLSPEAPIVLLRKRHAADAAALAPSIAPDNPAVGILLPYTPLHHLLLQAAAAPLVMTSGNRGGEPLCIDNDEALAQLAFADGFLLHDRPIARPCDDSVVFTARVAGASIPQLVRRSRGFAPLPVLLPAAITLSEPLVAAGADLKNVSAIAADRHVFLTQHIGDLRSWPTRLAHESALVDFETLFAIEPRVIVCDLHPDYASSRYARQRAVQEEMTLLEVQHHHAHVAACLAEHNRTDPAIGLAFDGTGYGTDGAIWGGEALLADLRQFERCCHLAYLPLPGGDAAIHKPYRIAFAYLRTLLPDINGREFLPDLSAQEQRTLQTMLDRNVNTPLTSSMGRLFDAVAALLGLCWEASHEAQAAIALENAAMWGTSDQPPYAAPVRDAQVQLAPLFAQLVDDLRTGRDTADIAWRFHRTVAQIAVDMVVYAQTHSATAPMCNTVALSGGVWQNRLLLEMTVPLLQAAGFDVLLHRSVPANDAGIAYGQAAIAAARLASSTCREAEQG